MTSSRFRCQALRRSGATEVRVIQAASADEARERLLAAGLEPVSIEEIGPSLFDGLRGGVDIDWRLPRWRPRLSLPTRPGMIAACLLAAIPFITAIGAWMLAITTAHDVEQLQLGSSASAYAGKPYLSPATRRDLASAMSRPTIGGLIQRLSAAIPQSASIASVMTDAKGQLTIAVETPDPDRLRLAIAADPLLARLAETGQSRTDDGAMRVTLRGAVS